MHAVGDDEDYVRSAIKGGIYLPFHFPNENPFYRCQIVS